MLRRCCARYHWLALSLGQAAGTEISLRSPQSGGMKRSSEQSPGFASATVFEEATRVGALAHLASVR